MSEVIVITSGKGGVGKTTTVANLGTALSFQNKNRSEGCHKRPRFDLTGRGNFFLAGAIVIF